jgi:hypothetical protein
MITDCGSFEIVSKARVTGEKTLAYQGGGENGDV